MSVVNKNFAAHLVNLLHASGSLSQQPILSSGTIRVYRQW
jgi:hypothetical protein